MDSWILTAVTFVPLLGAVIAMAMPNDDDELHKRWALAVSLVALGLGIAMLFDFNYDQAGQLQWVVDEPWIDVIGAGYTLGVDGMSLPLIALTVLVMPLVFLYSWNHIPSPGNTKSFLILMLILETGMIGTFVAQDLILFFVFFEVVLLPMFFMIAVWGGDDRRYASLKFFLYTLFGSALMLLGFLALFFLAKDPVTGEFLRTFDMRELTDTAGAGIARSSQLLIFGGMFIGFGVKVPMFPFHTWLPDAHTQAPTQGSVILAALLLKLGTYGFIRISIPMLPEAAEAFEKMKAAALEQGFELKVVSSYRSYDRQKAIWNRKFNRNQSEGLSPEENIKKIIEYSTLPGTSRHHWGTDIDIVDGAIPPEGDVLLTEKFHDGGPYEPLRVWLEENAASFGFICAYPDDDTRSGFYYEPWHYSYAPNAVLFYRAYLELNLPQLLLDDDLEGRDYLTHDFLTHYRQSHVRGIHPDLQ